VTTVIAVYDSEGCVGRCDFRCHYAKGSHCDCICGGVNHGAGLDEAIRNNYEKIGLTREDLERFAAAHQLDPADLFAVDRVAIKSNAKAKRIARMHLREPELPFIKPAEKEQVA
jgi:hypothetical protein